MPDRRHSTDQLTRELRSRRLSFSQRRKHLGRLEKAIAAGHDEIDGPRRRSRAEFGVLAAAVATLLVGFLVWTAVLDDTGASGDAPAATGQAGIGVTPASPPSPAEELALLEPPGFDAAQGVCRASAFATEVPPGVPRNDVRYLDWYGGVEAGLWAAPQSFGGSLPAGWPAAASLWFAGSPMAIAWYGTSTPVQLSGEQLDGDATLSLVVGEHISVHKSQTMTVTIPEPGCWSLRGSAGQQALELVVEVLPFAARPDLAIAASFFDARPYDVPESCPATSWHTPGQQVSGHHRLQAGGVRAQVNDLLFAEEELQIGVFGNDVTGDFAATVRRLDDASAEPQHVLTSLWNSDARLVIVAFPTSGCWELELTTPAATVSFVLYVYPDACRPELRDGAFVAECEAPRS